MGKSLAIAWLGLALALSSPAVNAADGRVDRGEGEGLTAHEWGTFLAMSGSDGAVLEGMYHEEHALPGFVHARSRDQLRMRSIFLKGETPVIYFYTDRPRQLGVSVLFPRGVWTQWYPQAAAVSPRLAQGGRPLEPKQGRIHWNVKVIPPDGSAGPVPLPPKAASGALWSFSREVDAAYVVAADGTKNPPRQEAERFLFYRGLGQATLPLRVSAGGGGTLAVDSSCRHEVRHLYVIRVEGEKGAYAYRDALRPGERVSNVIPDAAAARPLPEFSKAIGDDLARRLVGAGLFEKEARAMVNTWSSSYFGSEGVRALFVLPQAWTDEFIPLTIAPQPEKVVRVMVGRVELLTPAREQFVAEAVRGLGSADPAARGRAFEVLRRQGRYAEPVLRRVLRTTADERTRQLCLRLLSTGFVSDLRAASHDGGGEGRRQEEPEHVRAQLASLLREVGLVEEAKAEGQRALEALRKGPEPPFDRDDMRHYLRAYARASEGVGDDRAAAAGYARFIRFGSQVGTLEGCRGCHDGGTGPVDLAWFHDWWAGSKYASLVARLGEADREIAALEATLAKSPSDVAARMSLAYLLEGKGLRARADALWAGLSGPPARRATALVLPRGR